MLAFVYGSFWVAVGTPLGAYALLVAVTATRLPFCSLWTLRLWTTSLMVAAACGGAIISYELYLVV